MRFVAGLGAVAELLARAASENSRQQQQTGNSNLTEQERSVNLTEQARSVNLAELVRLSFWQTRSLRDREEIGKRERNK